MKLPSNATLEEKERFAYITADVEKAELYRQIEELQNNVPSCQPSWVELVVGGEVFSFKRWINDARQTTSAV